MSSAEVKRRGDLYKSWVFQIPALSVFLVILFRTENLLAAADLEVRYEQQRSAYCQMVNANACAPIKLDNGIKNIMEFEMSLECKERLSRNHCDLVKSTSPLDQQVKFSTCAITELCEEFNTEDIKSCLIEGFNLQFTKANLAIMGFTTGISLAIGSASIGAIVGLPFVIYGASQESETCDKNRDYKKASMALHNLMLLPSEKPLLFSEGQKDEALLKMTCAQLRPFLQNRMDTMVQRRGQRKLDGQGTGNEISIFDLAIQRSRCYRGKERIKSFCQEISGAATGILAGAGLSVAAKISLKSAAPQLLKNLEPSMDDYKRQLAAKPKRSLESFFLLNNIKKIDYKKIVNPSEIPDGIGDSFARLENGTFEGDKVFIKVSTLRGDGSVAQIKRTSDGRTAATRYADRWQREVYWVKRLSDLGIGPKFIGVTVTPDGQRAIVTELVEGFHYPNDIAIQELVKKLAPTVQLLEELKRIRSVLMSNNIQSEDLQLIVQPNRAVVIDPEMFENYTQKVHPNQGTINIEYFYLKLENIISEVEKAVKGTK